MILKKKIFLSELKRDNEKKHIIIQFTNKKSLIICHDFHNYHVLKTLIIARFNYYLVTDLRLSDRLSCNE